MTVGSDKGKKIDEIQIEWNRPTLVVRYHSSRYDPEFTVEAGDASFKGTNLKALLEKGRVHIEGWDKLKWNPVISINTEIYSELTFEYSRFFQSRHKGKNVYRGWRVGDVDEGSFGSRYKDENKAGTADTLDGGEPGMILSCRERGRIIEYTHDRWSQLRCLSKMLRDATDRTAKKLSEMLEQGDIDNVLAGATGMRALGVAFQEKKE